MGFRVSDELLGTFVPIAVYWIYSGFYELLGDLHNYRLHPKGEEDTKNVATKGMVVKGVLIQQAFQIAVSLLLFTFISDDSMTVLPQPSLILIVIQFAIAMIVMDELANSTGPRNEAVANHCREFMQSIKEIQMTLREEIKSASEYHPFEKCDYSARISNEICCIKQTIDQY